MKIIVDDAIPFIQGRIDENVEVVYLPGKDITPQHLTGADALVIRTRTRCDASLLEGSSVRLVATATIGTDHIDIPWCESHGITVTSAPGCNAPGVAQYLFASLFKAGFNPEKDTLGIIGYGNVGQTVADWAKKMGWKYMVSDNPRKKGGWKDIEYLDPEEVLSKCDAITLHVPLTKEGEFPTRHLIGKKELQMMKHGAILVNSSRGGVVDENALNDAISKGHVRGVVDVWENEPDINQSLLEKVFIATPHIAGYSAEGKMRATRMVLDSLSKHLGVKVDTRGLECIPKPGLEISKSLIEASYDPIVDSNNLRNNPSDFEKLRNCYTHRHEPLYINS
ncbi:MAG: 4-phosphoerythronate dehydrogenase [Muribaculaceae bacterium]|nr:4-phosphoerythronate dehydrogenase [Muribaculaceae bacterium]